MSRCGCQPGQSLELCFPAWLAHVCLPGQHGGSHGEQPPLWSLSLPHTPLALEPGDARGGMTLPDARSAGRRGSSGTHRPRLIPPLNLLPPLVLPAGAVEPVSCPAAVAAVPSLG